MASCKASNLHNNSCCTKSTYYNQARSMTTIANVGFTGNAPESGILVNTGLSGLTAKPNTTATRNQTYEYKLYLCVLKLFASLIIYLQPEIGLFR